MKRRTHRGRTRKETREGGGKGGTEAASKRLIIRGGGKGDTKNAQIPREGDQQYAESVECTESTRDERNAVKREEMQNQERKYRETEKKKCDVKKMKHKTKGDYVKEEKTWKVKADARTLTWDTWT